MTLRSTFLPVALPSIGEEEMAEVMDSLGNGWLTTGPKVKRFEKEFADYVGSPCAIAVNSWTGGYHVALRALGIGPGDEVILPTMTFCATANMVAHLGAKPVLTDVDNNLLMTPQAVLRAITPRTKLIVPVHYGGQACELDEILAIANSRGIPVLEDAAHAIGSEYKGAKIGTHGLITIFSFYATKTMTTGEGGMIATSDKALEARMRPLTLHGMSRDAWSRYTEVGSWYYEVEEPGYKYNMTDLQASIGLHQLRKLDGFIERRRAMARRYTAAFAGLDALRTPVELPGRKHAYYIYTVTLNPGEISIDRARFIEELKIRNIGASVHFIPLHRHPFYRDEYGYRPDRFPRAERNYEGLVSLPLYPKMTDRDQDDVIDAVRSVVAKFAVDAYVSAIA